ncbi:unnamed protein product [Macrosiphum euphorbiae]|uniref:Mos1 transposase HTH domain-containing protein n=5 Tax=Aphidinae TaxID=133076 RepID=A0AAV0VP94_9HEMI|nr:unnamed protein product [Macrosiphum euphorbiae]CAI6372097.1 unnamed protein product [Macrosiphum euphorbiae]
MNENSLKSDTFNVCAVFVMSNKLEQRVCIKFCVKLGKSATETFEMIKKAFEDEAMSRSKTFEWHKRFIEGREDINDDSRAGRPSTSRNVEMVAKVRKIIRSDRRMTIRELSTECNISFGSCQTILTEDLGMRRVCAKMVPKLLSQDQKNHRIEVCQNLKERTQNDPGFIKNVITGDETWVYGYDIETKRQSSQWKSVTSPRPKKARQVRSNVKTMLITFFDIKGLIYYEFVPTGQTVNQTYYKEVLIKLREKIRKKRPDQFQNRSWLLHHDNAPAHSALSIREFLADKQIPVVPHPPYSPDLAPCDFFLFPKIKTDLKGQRFDDIETIKKNAVDQLKQLKVEDFQHCFKKWQERWDKCITSGGEYFEGD